MTLGIIVLKFISSRTDLGKYDILLKPLAPRSDKYVISPCNFHTLSSKLVNEKTQTYQVEVVLLIKLQILITNGQGNVKQLEGRIYIQILGVKLLKHQLFQKMKF